MTRGLVWALTFPAAAVAVVMATRGPHWCLLPIWACGVVSVAHALRELARAGSPLRTGPAVWGFLVFLVFVAPLLHIQWDFWVRFAVLPADMRPWLGALGVWTLLGLLAMAGAQRAAARVGVGEWPARRELRPRRFVLFGAVLIALAAAAAIRVHVLFGGFAGLIGAFERGLGSFKGMGPLVVVASTMPTLAAALVLGLVPRRRLVGLGGPLLLLLAVLHLAIVGPFGSRAGILVPLLWAMVAWDRMVAPIRWRPLLLLGVVAFSFLFVYGFYKSIGRGAFAGSISVASVQEKVRETGRSLEFLILLDLGRYDVQALLLERRSGPDPWRLGRGRTYVGGLLSLVPNRFFPGKPDSKVREGTDALRGAGSFDRDGIAVTNQFGLAGEAVLNFGAAGIPVVYALFGLVVGLVSRLESVLPRRDPRWLLLAFAPPIAVRALTIDSDNVALVLVNAFLFLGPLVWFAIRGAAGSSKA